jgi:hypothetical protein
MTEPADRTAGHLSNMNTPSLPNSSARRPAFRVICAWCQQDIEGTQPAENLTGDSHGICAPCARRHFGCELELVACAA